MGKNSRRACTVFVGGGTAGPKPRRGAGKDYAGCYADRSSHSLTHFRRDRVSRRTGQRGGRRGARCGGVDRPRPDLRLGRGLRAGPGTRHRAGPGHGDLLQDRPRHQRAPAQLPARPDAPRAARGDREGPRRAHHPRPPHGRAARRGLPGGLGAGLQAFGARSHDRPPAHRRRAGHRRGGAHPHARRSPRCSPRAPGTTWATMRWTR